MRNHRAATRRAQPTEVFAGQQFPAIATGALAAAQRFITATAELRFLQHRI
jgi:hypothetical protein